MKKSFIFINILMCLAVMIGDFCYMKYGTILIKGIASGLFVLTGIINLIYCIKNKLSLKFPIFLVCALFIAMLGDIFLNIEFIVGGIIFAIGHVIFIVAYCMLHKFKWLDLIFMASVLIPSILIVLFLPSLNFSDISLKVLCICYAAIISVMVGKSLSNLFRQKSFLNLNILIGSILFFVSDLMLLLSKFAKVPNTGTVCLLTYYPALFLLAFSIFFFADEKLETNHN
ncbi:MAG: lysoplasmalogenase [Clostridiales bacterium]|nr:lysoplasmalogenase [Clostridiales bacterium]